MGNDPQLDLATASISAVLGFGSNRNTLNPWFHLLAMESLLIVSLFGTVQMSVFRDSDDLNSDDLSVIDVNCDLRMAEMSDFASYPWGWNSMQMAKPFWFIEFYGTITFQMVCERYEVVREPLSLRYPEEI